MSSQLEPLYPCSNCGVSLMEIASKIYPSTSSDMLNSNTVFPTVQLSQFSKTIADIKADMWVLNNEMSRLQKAMDHLATERQKLQTSLDGHLSLVAPIRRIPAEIQFSPIAVSTMEASVLRKRHCCSRLCAVNGEELLFPHHICGHPPFRMMCLPRWTCCRPGFRGEVYLL